MNTKKGFTIVELLITVGLFTIIIAIAVGGFTNALRTQRQVSSLISAQSNVSLVLEQIARQVRTGYLFCNTLNNTQAVAGGNPNGAAADCGCTLTVSPDPNGFWTCNALDFYDAESNHLVYFLQNGALMETNNATTQSVTGDAVSVKYLQFHLYGQVENDQIPPRITISIGIAPSSTDPAVMNNVSSLETTVSARTIDCVPGTQQC